MPVKTFNGLGVSSVWTPPAPTYAPPDRPWLTLDINVIGTDVVVRISEEPSYVMDDTQDSEILFRQGFKSVVVPPFWAIKFKVWSGTALAPTGTVDVTLKA